MSTIKSDRFSAAWLHASPLASEAFEQSATIRQPGQRIDVRVLDEQVLQVLGSQGGAYAGTQFKGVERLRNVVDRSNVQPLDLVFGRAIGAQEDDGDHA